MCSAPAPVDHSVTIAASVLGGVYAIAAISAIAFVVIPRMMARRAAALAGRPVAAALSRRVRAARPLPRGIRWAPSYGDGMVRTRPGAYVPRDDFEMERMTRVPAAPDHRSTANQVWLYPLHFVCRQSQVKRAVSEQRVERVYNEGELRGHRK